LDINLVVRDDRAFGLSVLNEPDDTIRFEPLEVLQDLFDIPINQARRFTEAFRFLLGDRL